MSCLLPAQWLIIISQSNKRIRHTDSRDTSSSTNTSNRTFNNSGNTVLITAVLTLVLLFELRNRNHHSDKHTFTAGLSSKRRYCLPPSAGNPSPLRKQRSLALSSRLSGSGTILYNCSCMFTMISIHAGATRHGSFSSNNPYGSKDPNNRF